jgi:hypothetical protein
MSVAGTGREDARADQLVAEMNGVAGAHDARH